MNYVLKENSEEIRNKILAAEAREKIMAAAEQCEHYPKDMLADWLRDDVFKGVQSKTNQLLYEFAEKHDMSLHDVCMRFMPKYDYHVEPFDAKGNPSPMFNVNISLEPMPLDLEQDPGYWKGKYFKLKEQMGFKVENGEIVELNPKSPAVFNEMLDRPITDYPLSVRALTCLKSADINTLRELVRLTEMDLLKFRNFGKKSISELSDFIKDHDLTWGMNV